MSFYKHNQSKFGLCIIASTFASTFVSPTYASQQACNVVHGENIIYVHKDANPAGNGKSWKTAFSDLSTAIAYANTTKERDQIWIAQGEYSSSTYTLDSDIVLIGGFSGSETEINQRNPITHKTILSSKGVSQRVLFANNIKNIQIMDLTVAGGNATGKLSTDDKDLNNEVRGGGLLAFNSNLILCNTTFKNNSAKKFGGAVYVEGGALTIINSLFAKNKVLRNETEIHDTLEEADTDGGAVAAHNTALRVESSTFEDNVAGDDGAAISGRQLSVAITGSVFKRNKGIATLVPQTLPVFTNDLITSMGGAVSIQNEYIGQNLGDQSQEVTIQDSRFYDNHSEIASAVFILGSPGSKTLIKNTRFFGHGGSGQAKDNVPANEVGVRFGRGAAAVLLVGSRAGDREVNDNNKFIRPLHNATISNSYFANNEAGQGGAIVFISLDVSVDQTIFKNNIARMRGGAIWNQNFFSLFDQFSGLEPDIGSTIINRSTFKHNKTLGILEDLQADSFPGVATNEEQTYGGGAICNDQSGILKVLNSTFIGNTSVNSDGGAIQNASSPVIAYASVSSPSFYPARLSIKNTLFYRNSTTGNGSGGAISNGATQVNGSIIDADGQDRRFDASGSQLSIRNSRFYFNTATDNGGAIASWNAASLNLERSLVMFNSASTGGGVSVVGHEDNPATYSAKRVKIKGNSASNGKNTFIINTN